MRARRTSIAAAAVVVAIGVAAWSRPAVPDAAGDPSLALSARTTVPPRVMATLLRACFDCHSNETRWPWYSKLPIASWLLEADVKAARGQLNFSKWSRYNPFDRAGLLDKVCELASAGKMPLPRYLMLHHEARLSQTDIDQLCAWTEHEATRLVQGGS